MNLPDAVGIKENGDTAFHGSPAHLSNSIPFIMYAKHIAVYPGSTTASPVTDNITLYTALEPLVFCERWLGLEKMSELKRCEIVHGFGFRSQCNQILSSALGLSPETPKKWGADFEKMPQVYRYRLAQALFYKQAHNALLLHRGKDIVINVVLGKEV